MAIYCALYKIVFPFPCVAAVGDAWPAVDNIDVLPVVVGFIAETVT
jgi:hypothetical protein